MTPYFWLGVIMWSVLAWLLLGLVLDLTADYREVRRWRKDYREAKAREAKEWEILNRKEAPHE